jgi:hypothetical protein
MAQEKTLKISAVAYEMLQVIAEKNRQRDPIKYLEQFIKQQYSRIRN